MLEVCGSFLLWRFFPVGRVGQVACQGFMVREACVGVLEGGGGSPPSSAMKCPVMSYEMSVGLE